MAPRPREISEALCEGELLNTGTEWNGTERNIPDYNPPNNFCGLSLDKTGHVMRNWTMYIRGYPPSDLISVV